jgi:hypothetical protein
MTNTNETAEPSGASAGSHGSASRWNGVPVAWAAVGQNGVPLWLAYHRQDAQGAVVGMAQVVPLYRSPALTDAEREAIAGAMWDYGQYADELGLSVAEVTERQATLRGLLDRTE